MEDTSDDRLGDRRKDNNTKVTSLSVHDYKDIEGVIMDEKNVILKSAHRELRPTSARHIGLVSSSMLNQRENSGEKTDMIAGEIIDFVANCDISLSNDDDDDDDDDDDEDDDDDYEEGEDCSRSYNDLGDQENSDDANNINRDDLNNDELFEEFSEDNLYDGDSDISINDLSGMEFIDGGSKDNSDDDWDMLMPKEKLLNTSDAHIVAKHVDPNAGTISAFTPRKKQLEKIRRNNLRNHIQEAKENVAKQHSSVDELRSDLIKCKTIQKQLITDRVATFENVEKLREQNKMTFSGIASQKLIDAEAELLEIEKQLREVERSELSLEHDLKDAEIATVKAEATLARAGHMETKIDQYDAAEFHENTLVATFRSLKEKKVVRRLKERQQANETNLRRLQDAQLEKAARVAANAHKSRHQAIQRLSDTITKMRAEEEEEAAEKAAHHQRRVAAVLDLKHSIDSTQEQMRGQNQRKEQRRIRAIEKQKQEADAILAAGGNPEEVFRRRRFQKQLGRQRKQFEVMKQQNQEYIVKRIIAEEQVRLRSKRKNTSVGRKKRDVRRHSGSKLSTTISDAQTSGTTPVQSIAETNSRVSGMLGEGTSQSSAVYSNRDSTETPGIPCDVEGASSDNDSSDSNIEDVSMTMEEDEKDRITPTVLPHSRGSAATSAGAESRAISNISGGGDEAWTGENYEEDLSDEEIVKPEFCGLWEHSQGAEEGADDDSSSDMGSYKVAASKMERDMMRRALERQRESIIKQQVVAGRTFTGASAFISKPGIVTFSDFEVGRVYKKRMILTNVSYSVNTFKVLPLSVSLRDFIELQYTPPGFFSAGLTCEILVIFTPRMNEDITDSLKFLAETGPFEVPVHIRRKRSIVSLSSERIEISDVCLGEFGMRQAKFVNDGALGTTITMSRRTGASAASDVAGLSNKSEETNDELVDCHAQDICLQTDGSHFDGGHLAAHSELQFDIVFTPSTVGDVQATWDVKFSDSDTPGMTLVAFGHGSDVPIYVQQSKIEMGVCLVGTMYRQVIVIMNRGSVPMKVLMNVPREMRSWVQLSPKIGFVQGSSSFACQLAFTPDASILDAFPVLRELGNSEIELPLRITVPNQTLPVNFVIHATITDALFDFSLPSIDFGYCTLYESVVVPLTITNNCLLPQKFGFVDLPVGIVVEPDNGFGVLLPKESLVRDIIYSPETPGDLDFQITCKSGFGCEFKLPCRGQGIEPPLRLTDTIIEYPATSVGDFTSASIFIVNSDPTTAHTFEFVVPSNAPIRIIPVVGTVPPRQRSRIQVMFIPTDLHDTMSTAVDKISFPQSTTAEAASMERHSSGRRKQSGGSRSSSRASGGKSSGKRRGSRSSGSKKLSGSSNVSNKSDLDLMTDELEPSHEQLAVANEAEVSKNNIAKRIEESRAMEAKCEAFTVSCFIKDENKCCLYMEVRTPTVPPELIVITSSGREYGGKPLCDFGKVPLGQSMTQTLILQNITCDKTLQVSSTALDPVGPFAVLTAFRKIKPGEQHRITVYFDPESEAHSYEVLELHAGHTKVAVRLSGIGVRPTVDIKSSDIVHNVLDVGDVMVADSATRQFTVINTSAFDVSFRISLTSHNAFPNAISDIYGANVLVDHETAMPIRRTPVHAIKNRNNQSAFDVVPAEAMLHAGESRIINVRFSPDHESIFYHDSARLEVSTQEEQYVLRLEGRAWSFPMYVIGGDVSTEHYDDPLQSSSLLDKADPTGSGTHGTLLLVFKVRLSDGDDLTANRELQIGFLGTSGGAAAAPAGKGNKSIVGEFVFDNLPADAIAEGFSIDTVKGIVDAGTRRAIIVQFAPPKEKAIGRWVEFTVQMTLRISGSSMDNEMQKYALKLRGYIIT